MLFDVIWSLEATSNLTQFYFEVEVKEDQILNYPLLSWRISHDRLHIELRDSQKEDINISRLTFKVCCPRCTSWSSVNLISNFKFSTFFRVLFALWSLKYPHPKSQQTPRVSTELEMAVNLSYSFIPLQKILQKGVDRQLKTRGRTLKLSKRCRKRRTNFKSACAKKMWPPPFLSSRHFLRRRLISKKKPHFYRGGQFLCNRLTLAWKIRTISQSRQVFIQKDICFTAWAVTLEGHCTIMEGKGSYVFKFLF